MESSDKFPLIKTSHIHDDAEELIVTCASFTWFLILYGNFVVLFVMILGTPFSFWKLVNAVLFHVLVFMALASHLRTMFSDPGAIPKGNATMENIKKLGFKEGQVVLKCGKCSCIKESRAHHCSICQRCIRKMDHHCPWVNNCVGEKNQKYFVLFTLYIFLISFHGVAMGINHVIQCMHREWTECSLFSPTATLVLMIFYFFEGLLFGLFTVVMCCSQVCAIFYDETGIEQLKKEAPTWQRRSKWLSLKAVFGHPFSLRWLSPFHSPNIFSASYDLFVDV